MALQSETSSDMLKRFRLIRDLALEAMSSCYDSGYKTETLGYIADQASFAVILLEPETPEEAHDG